jgi:hypothetical protein
MFVLSPLIPLLQITATNNVAVIKLLSILLKGCLVVLFQKTRQGCCYFSNRQAWEKRDQGDLRDQIALTHHGALKKRCRCSHGSISLSSTAKLISTKPYLIDSMAGGHYLRLKASFGGYGITTDYLDHLTSVVKIGERTSTGLVLGVLTSVPDFGRLFPQLFSY